MIRKRLLILWFSFLAGGGISLLAPPSLLAGDETVYLGAARTDITPPAGTPLFGFARRRGRPSEGVHDPLYARSLSLKKRGKTFVFVSVDTVLVDRDLRREIVRKVREQVPLDESGIVITATHTHSGSGAVGRQLWERFIGGRFHRERFDELTTRIAKTIVESVQDPVPVSVEGGEADTQALVENRMDKKLAYPSQIKVLRFKKDNGDVGGELVFFAAHPTLLPAKYLHFSGDFPGALAALLEEKHEGSVALFINGAVGDLRPNPIHAETPEKEVEIFARSLFERIGSIDFESVSLEGEWANQRLSVRLPSVKLRAGFFRFPYFIGNRIFPRRTIFQMLRMGKLLFIGFPGEVTSETGYLIEERARGYGFEPYFLGLANDYVGYVVPERYYLDRSHYEARASFYGRKFDFFVHQTVDRMIGEFLEEKPRRYFARRPGLVLRGRPLPVLYLRGNAYERGYEHGRLMAKEMRRETRRIFAYLSGKLYVPGLSRIVVKSVLMRTWKKMEPYVFYDELMEIQGLADGSGLSLSEVKRLHAIPDLIESFCSNGVYFDSATEGGDLIHVRNLDWVREMGVHRLAALIVQRPDEGIPFINIGYYGFIGVLTGVNERGISVGQIGADSVDETLRGTPMPFLLRRVLLRADDLEEAASIVTQVPRTTGTHYVFADARRKKAIAIETTAHHAEIFKPNDPKETGVFYALPLESALVRADTAMDPVIRNLQIASQGDPKKKGLEPPDGSSAYETRYKKHTELVKKYYGELDSDKAREIAQSIAPDSNLQSVVFRFPDFWVANATSKLPAAKTDYHPFNYEALFEELESLVKESERSELKVRED
jgi:hypothetical protein